MDASQLPRAPGLFVAEEVLKGSTFRGMVRAGIRFKMFGACAV